MSLVIKELEATLAKVKNILNIEVNHGYEQAVEKYGNTIIRVHWRYVDSIKWHKNLKMVAIWPNGDQGYILIDENEDSNKDKLTEVSLDRELTETEKRS